MPIMIHSLDAIPTNCGFSDSEIIKGQNRKHSDAGVLPKCLKLKLESKVMVTTNLDFQD